MFDMKIRNIAIGIAVVGAMIAGGVAAAWRRWRGRMPQSLHALFDTESNRKVGLFK
jgi:hypothetical protein